jgi:hypothetical protein
MRINPMFRRKRAPTSEIPPHYLQLARHWRMGAKSSDTIRQRLMQRGISWETSLAIVACLDREDADVGTFSLARRSPRASAWFMAYALFIVLGSGLVFLNQLMVRAGMRCDLAGYFFISIGVVGLCIYGLNMLLWRFL